MKTKSRGMKKKSRSNAVSEALAWMAFARVLDKQAQQLSASVVELKTLKAKLEQSAFFKTV